MASLSASSRLVLLTALFALLGVPPANAKLQVVAALPDVADIARQIGGDRVSVVTIAEGSQDPHKVPVKPSFVTKLNRADALVVQGLGLEHTFLPALLEVASNPKILPTGAAYIDASIYVQPLEVPTSQNRSQGELHPLGNPHFNLDPVQGKRMARAIAEGLTRIDPAGAASYQAGLVRTRGLDSPDRRVGEARQRRCAWGKRSLHQDLVYLAARFGLEWSARSRPNRVPATPGHLERGRQPEAGAGQARDPRGRLRARAGANGRGANRARVATISTLAGGLPGNTDLCRFDRRQPESAAAGGAGGTRVLTNRSPLLAVEEADFGYEGAGVRGASLVVRRASWWRCSARTGAGRRRCCAGCSASCAARRPRRAPAGPAHRLRAPARDTRHALSALGLQVAQTGSWRDLLSGASRERADDPARGLPSRLPGRRLRSHRTARLRRSASA